MTLLLDLFKVNVFAHFRSLFFFLGIFLRSGILLPRLLAHVFELLFYVRSRTVNRHKKIKNEPVEDVKADYYEYQISHGANIPFNVVAVRMFNQNNKALVFFCGNLAEYKFQDGRQLVDQQFSQIGDRILQAFAL